MLLLGLTGGIASGKSSVSKMLEKLGAYLIDFDVLSRIVVMPKKSAWREIAEFFGESVLNSDKTINRAALRNIVFEDIEKRKKLESIIHPRIHKKFKQFVEEYAMEEPDCIIQASVPLLIENNMQADFDCLLMVYIPKDEQIKRLIKRDGLSREMAQKMIESQMPIEEKKGLCHFVINNSGTIQETEKEAAHVWEKIKNANQYE